MPYTCNGRQAEMPVTRRSRVDTCVRSHYNMRNLAAVVAPLVAFALGGCGSITDSLLEVDLPGQVAADDLNSPPLAETLVRTAESDFECGLVDYIWYPGQWFNEFLDTSGGRPNALIALRSQLVEVYADPCASGTGPIYTPIQLPRIDARLAIDLIGGFDVADVPRKDFLIAKAKFYEAYSIQLLGEMFCGVTVDGGPEMTRAAAWTQAAGIFGEVISIASGVTGSDASAAAALVTGAYIGRARAKLNLGDMPGVIADASMVTDPTFAYRATYDASPVRRRNRIYTNNNQGSSLMPNETYLDLTVRADGVLTQNDGVPDPRVEIIRKPGQFGSYGIITKRDQQKYMGRDAPIPFATYREAQLMIAEASGGATAVSIINALRDTHPSIASLDFVSTDPAEIEATVREERRRELWMQGTLAGDKLRWGTPFETVNEYGSPLAPGGCMKIPLLERVSNGNL